MSEQTSDDPPTYPFSLEEARADARIARRVFTDLGRKRAALVKKVADADRDIAGCRIMLRTIVGVYPELAEHVQTEAR